MSASTRPLSRATSWIGCGQIVFLVFLGVCIGINPGLVIKRDEAGLSNYGVHASTVIPYTIAFAGCVGGSLVGSRRLRSGLSHATLVRGLQMYAFLMTAILVSSYVYSLSNALRILHVTIGSIALTLITAWSVWLYRRTPRVALDVIAIIVTITGYLVSATTIAGAWHLLFAGQVANCVGVSIVLVRAVATDEQVRSRRET